MKTSCLCKKSTIKQTGPRSLERCPACGIKYSFTINIDGTAHLFRNGRLPADEERRKRPYSVSWSQYQDKRTKGAGWTRQRLLDYAYRKIILRLDD